MAERRNEAPKDDADKRAAQESSLDEAYSRQNATWGRESIAQTDFTGGVIDEMARGRLEHEIYKKALEGFNYGLAAAGGVLAIILANLVSIFLVRFVGDNLAE